MSLSNPGHFRKVWLSPSKELERKKSSTVSPPPNLTTTTSIANFRGGLVVKQANNVVVFIKKIQLEWTIQWQFLAETPIDELFCNDTDDLFLTSNESLNIMKEIPGEPRFVAPFSSIYDFIKFFDILNPFDEYIIVVTKNNHILAKHGLEVASIYEEISSINCLFSHPTLPIICVGDDIGTVYILSYLDVASPKLTVKCRPGKDRVSHVSIEADFIIIIDVANRIFLGQVDSESLRFVHSFQISSSYVILKTVSYKSESDLEIIFLLKDNHTSHTANLFKKFTFDGESLIEETYTSEHNYIMIGLDGSKNLYGLQEDGIEFHSLSPQEESMDIVKKFDTPIRKITFFVQDNYFVCWNCCGEISIIECSQFRVKFFTTISKNSEDFKFKFIRIIGNEIIFLTCSGKLFCYEFDNVPEKTKIEMGESILLNCEIFMNDGRFLIFLRLKNSLNI